MVGRLGGYGFSSKHRGITWSEVVAFLPQYKQVKGAGMTDHLSDSQFAYCIGYHRQAYDRPPAPGNGRLRLEDTELFSVLVLAYG